jgi:hypothetical protein
MKSNRCAAFAALIVFALGAAGCATQATPDPNRPDVPSAMFELRNATR